MQFSEQSKLYSYEVKREEGEDIIYKFPPIEFKKDIPSG